MFDLKPKLYYSIKSDIVSILLIQHQYESKSSSSTCLPFSRTPTALQAKEPLNIQQGSDVET